MYDLVIDVDGRANEIQHLVERIDGHIDAGAEAARFRQNNPHRYGLLARMLAPILADRKAL